MSLEICGYCGKRMCAAVTGSTNCGPDLYHKKFSKEEIEALKEEWNITECDLLCTIAPNCQQLILSDGNGTWQTPLAKGIDPEQITMTRNPELRTPWPNGDGTIACAGFTPRA